MFALILFTSKPAHEKCSIWEGEASAPRLATRNRTRQKTKLHELGIQGYQRKEQNRSVGVAHTRIDVLVYQPKLTQASSMDN